MSTCKYCGEKAGFFSSAHREWEEKHALGMSELEKDLQRYFNMGISAADIASKIRCCRKDNFLSDDDIASIFGKVVCNFGQEGVGPMDLQWRFGLPKKITREFVGRSSGLSFRVMKGVYYRTGRMKGHPVEHSSMELQGTGTLYVTNKNLIFYSETKNIKIPFNKIIGITPYSDGVEVHRDGTTAKCLTMQGFDPWFLMNVLSNISNL